MEEIKFFTLTKQLLYQNKNFTLTKQLLCQNKNILDKQHRRII